MIRNTTTLLVLLFFGFQMFSQFTEKHAKTVRDFVGIIKTQHWATLNFDTEKQTAFKIQLINNLDPEKLFFTASDSVLIANTELNIENIKRLADLNSAKQIAKLYKRKIRMTDSVLSAIKTPEMQKVTAILTENSAQKFASDENQREIRIRNALNLTSLNILFTDKTQTNENAYQLATQRMHCALAKNTAGFEDKFIEILLNSYAEVYDPHTTFFSAAEKSLLETILLSNSFSYGIGFSEDNSGNIVTDELTPGGPAWRSMQIQEDDILKEIFPEGQLASTTECLDLQTVYELLHNPEHHILVFKFLKKNGKTVEVSLLKEIIENAENSIEGYILQGKHKIGYVYIPDFYTSDTDTLQSGCSVDLARALVELKAENIESLIVDLRDNTGGSVQEAADMCGLFIDYGTVAIYTAHYGKPTYLKDSNRGMAYSGPLIVLVNEYSASASEIFAAAMQDYNRALIVGTKTFGKGSAQVIRAVTDNPENIDIVDILGGIPGYIKVTTDKMYRITGQTHQRNGIAPDVELPKIKTFFDYSEADYPHVLDNEPLEKKAYFTPLAPIATSDLRQKSNARCAAWQWSADSISGEWDLLFQSKNLHELTDREYLQTLAEIEHLSETSAALQDYNHNIFTISGTKNTLDFNKLNNIDTKHYLKHIDNLQKDRYLYGVYQIMTDYLELLQKK